MARASAGRLGNVSSCAITSNSGLGFTLIQALASGRLPQSSAAGGGVEPNLCVFSIPLASGSTMAGMRERRPSSKPITS